MVVFVGSVRKIFNALLEVTHMEVAHAQQIISLGIVMAL
jgi:hypothetical protein